MGHDHSHSHSHHSQVSAASLKLILGLSFSYMVAEIVGGWLSGSLALIADAGHMLIDSFSIALSLFAVWISHRPPSAKRTYGYHRVEILAALVNGSTLLAASLWIFYKAWGRFENPEPIQGGMMLIIALGGLLVNLVSLFILKKHAHEGLNMRGAWLHVLFDTLGSVSAVVAAFLVLEFNWLWADPIVSCLISLMILHGAWKLVTECVDVLLESTPRDIQIDQVRELISSVHGVEDIHDLHIWTVKSGIYSLSAHVRIQENLDHSKVLTEITQLLSNRFGIHHTTIQLEGKGFEHSGPGLKECSLSHS